MWHILSHVVDNFGDAGVALRLARALSLLNKKVVLWCDQPNLILKMLGEEKKTNSFSILNFNEKNKDGLNLKKGDVLVEMFSFPLPSWVNEKIENNLEEWVWLQVEYLGVEEWVVDCHLKPSPQKNNRVKYFYFPSILKNAGALNVEKENNLNHFKNKNKKFTLNAFFYYSQPFENLTYFLNQEFKEKVEIINWVNSKEFVSQKTFDSYLNSADLNLIRGEDSFVQGIFAQKPFLWQAYPQENKAHFVKVESFLKHFLPYADFEIQQTLEKAFCFWNGIEKNFNDWEFLFDHWALWEKAVVDFSKSIKKPKNLAEDLVDFVEYLQKKRS